MDFWTSGAWVEWFWVGCGVAGFVLAVTVVPGWILDYFTRRAARRRIGESLDPIREMAVRRDDLSSQQPDSARRRTDVIALQRLRARKSRLESRVIWHE